jgi:chitinase
MRPGSSALTLLLVLLCGCTMVQPTATYEIVGYYPGWKGKIEVDARQLTVLNYAFLDICWDAQHGNASSGGFAPCKDIDGAAISPPNGSVVVDNPAAEAANLAGLSALKAANPHLRLVASVGGWTRSNRFSDMAASGATRANFIDSVIAFLRRHRFDGIDLDWEYPTAIGVPCAAGYTCERASDKQNFVTLAQQLRAALDAAGASDAKRYLSTIAAGADQSYVFDPDGSSQWLAQLARSLDWINLMTYDYHGTWERSAGFVAPLHRDADDPTPTNANATVTLYLRQGIPPRKLTLGEPFYGKGWAGCAAGAKGDGLYQPCTGLASGSEEATFEFAWLTERGYLARDAWGRYTLGGLGFERYWNSDARVPYLYNASTQVFIAYDDEASIHEKNRYVIDQGLLGAMFWELNADRHRVLGTVVSDDLGKVPGDFFARSRDEK